MAVKSFATLAPGGNFQKKFLVVIYEYSKRSRVFVPGKPFQLSLMFLDKARSLPKGGVPERYIAQVGSCLTHKHRTRLERPARDKHPRFFGKFINYGHKKFCNIGPWWQFSKTFFRS
jgi:hypothetical protein